MSTALAEVKAPEVTADQLRIVERELAKGATPEQVKMFLYDCARQNIHPLDRFIHCTIQSGKYTPITSIDFMRMRAADTGEYCGNDDPTFDRDEEGELIAHVTVWRLIQGQRCPFTATARWSEYYPGEKKGFIWDKMPYLMISKCAEALALRKGFPRQLHGLYAAEEMDQAGRETPAAKSSQPPNWKKASPEQKTEMLLERVLLLNTAEDCEESIKKLMKLDLGQVNQQRVLEAIQSRRAQIATDLADAPWEAQSEPGEKG